MNRREKILQAIDVACMRGVEIGPLANPVLRKNEAQVLYADHASTAELRAKYEGHGWDTATTVEVDVVLSEKPLLESLQHTRVDFVIANYVVEHVPNLIRWFGELHDALNPGGIVALSIPEGRYCFDAKRPLSTTGEIVDAWLSQRTIPSLKQVFDFWSLYTIVDTPGVWDGSIDTSRLPLAGTLENALSRTRALAAAPRYTDVHCWVFTPHSFLHCIADLIEMDLLLFDVKYFHTTSVYEFEFIVSLERIEPMSTDVKAARVARLRAMANGLLGSSPLERRNYFHKQYKNITLKVKKALAVGLKQTFASVKRKMKG